MLNHLDEDRGMIDNDPPGRGEDPNRPEPPWASQDTSGRPVGAEEGPRAVSEAHRRLDDGATLRGGRTSTPGRNQLNAAHSDATEPGRR